MLTKTKSSFYPPPCYAPSPPFPPEGQCQLPMTSHRSSFHKRVKKQASAALRSQPRAPWWPPGGADRARSPPGLPALKRFLGRCSRSGAPSCGAFPLALGPHRAVGHLLHFLHILHHPRCRHDRFHLQVVLFLRKLQVGVI